MTEDNATPFSDFLDDYFAECDEHLMGVRRLLLALEVSVGRADIDRGVLDELFRHFHSLKGISGMVELRPAEDLAHHLEDYLRALRQGEAILTAEGVDALFDGAQMLEQVIGARRAGTASPSIDAVVGRIAHLVATVASPEERASATAASALPARRRRRRCHAGAALRPLRRTGRARHPRGHGAEAPLERRRDPQRGAARHRRRRDRVRVRPGRAAGRRGRSRRGATTASRSSAPPIAVDSDETRRVDAGGAGRRAARRRRRIVRRAWRRRTWSASTSPASTT